MRRYALVCLLLSALIAGCSSKGKVRKPAELQRIEAPEVRAEIAWSRSAGKGSGDHFAKLHLAVEADAVFAADIAGRVFAFDPRNGRPVWETDTKARVVAGPGVSGDLVLVGTLDAEVIALSRADGREKWRTRVSSEVMAPPVGEGNTVVVRTVDGRVIGLSAETGERRWMLDRSVPNLTLRGLSKPLIAGNVVYVGFDNGRLGAFKLEDGSPVWEQVVAPPSGRTELERIADIDANLLDSGRTLFAASFGGEVAALDVDDGEVRWRRSIKSYTGFAALDNQIIVSDEAGVVWALDVESGAALWKQEGLLNRRLSPPAVFGDAIAVGDFEGYVHWLNPKDGRIIGRTRAARDPIRAPLVATDELLYVLASDGKISALRRE